MIARHAILACTVLVLFTASAAAQTVTGSGTTNTVPVFTGSSNIGNSPISVSGSNVGIGTTTPTDALDVTGQVVFGNPSAGRLSLGAESLGFNRKIATGVIYNSGEYAYQFQ